MKIDKSNRPFKLASDVAELKKKHSVLHLTHLQKLHRLNLTMVEKLIHP